MTMIEEFTKRYFEKIHELRAKIENNEPTNYLQLVQYVIEILHDPQKYGSIDPKRITEIDHGQYQGTLLYVIAASNYQPDEFWYCKIEYGSCSGCDTLEQIFGEEDPNERVKQFMQLACHVVQNLRKMDSAYSD